MYDVSIGGYRPVQAPQQTEALSSSASAEKASAPASAALQTRDTAALSGKQQTSPPMTAEQALSRLYEMGLLSSASRPLESPPSSVPAATLILTLQEETAAGEDAPQNLPAEAGEEWRPYQPPSLAESLFPGTVSADGHSLLLSLFGAEDSTSELLLQAAGLTLPLDAEGALLAGFLDGSFRFLMLNQGVLEQLLGAGLAELVPAEASENAASPQEGQAPLPQQQAEVRGQQSAQQPSPATEQTRAASSPQPAAADTAARASGTSRASSPFAPPAPHADAVPRSDREVFSLVRALTRDAVPVGEKPVPPDLPDSRSGGVSEWISERNEQQTLREATQFWLEQTRQSPAGESQPKSEPLRQPHAAPQPNGSPAAGQPAQETNSVPGGKSIPHYTAASEPRQSLPSGTLPAQTPPAETRAALLTSTDSAANWLRTLFSAAPPTGTDAESMLKSLMLSEEQAGKQSDDSVGLARRLSDYLSQLYAGSLHGNTRERSDLLDLPQQPQREEGERERAWKRRQIAYEVDSAWTSNLKEWMVHVDGWRISRSQDYVNSKSNEWTSGLMKTQPAQFRQWLTSPVRYAASTGWFNGATASFPINTLPEGFTEEDLRLWLRWDVLDFL